MTIEQMREIIALVKFPDYTFVLIEDGGKVFLKATFIEADIVTGKPEVQTTRKWVISEHAVKSEIVQTAFKCILTSMEHRAREHFTYKDKRIFGPHFDVEALWEICKDKRLDYRGRNNG